MQQWKSSEKSDGSIERYDVARERQWKTEWVGQNGISEVYGCTPERGAQESKEMWCYGVTQAVPWTSSEWGGTK